MMLVGFAALGWCRRAPWTFAGLGALAWTSSVAAKVLAAAVTVPFLNDRLGASHPITIVWVGLLTGIFECGLVLPLVRWTRLRDADWDRAVAFGVAFGAFEAIILGLLYAIVAALVLLFFDSIPETFRGPVLKEFAIGSPVIVVFPMIERVLAILAHVLSCVLLVRAVQAREWRWFWLAFAYKSAMDAVAAVVIASSLPSGESIVRTALTEAAFVPFAVVAVVALPRLRPAFEAGRAPT